jgi:hypothetical protein
VIFCARTSIDLAEAVLVADAWLAAADGPKFARYTKLRRYG